MQGVVVAGLGMGETEEEREKVLDTVLNELPEKHVRMLIGLSSPSEMLKAMESGIDMISSPCPYVFARSGHALTFALEESRADDDEAIEGPSSKKRRLGGHDDVQLSSSSFASNEQQSGVMHLWDRRWRRDKRALVEGCECLACRRHSRAYIHHLLLAHEMLAEVLLYAHNLEHYLRLFEKARHHILVGSLREYRQHIERVCAGV